MRYCDEHPEKIVIATGDTNQLETIDAISNQLNYDDYTNYCVNSISRNLMFVQENKRLKKKSDRAKLRNFKRDIFDETISVKDTIEKYFKFTTKAETEHNIAYKNTTCKMVSKWTNTRWARCSYSGPTSRCLRRSRLT